MSKVISQRELRNQNAAVMDAVVAGETFVVTRNGTPVAELRRIMAPRRRFLPREELAVAVATGPQIDARHFRSDLDRVVDPTLR